MKSLEAKKKLQLFSIRMGPRPVKAVRFDMLECWVSLSMDPIRWINNLYSKKSTRYGRKCFAVSHFTTYCPLNAGRSFSASLHMVGRQGKGEEKCVIKSFRIYALYALHKRSLRRSKQKV